MEGLGTLGLSDEHVELHTAVRRWVAANVRAADTKAMLDVDPKDDALPIFWPALVEQGWLGLHVAEAYGGEGFGLPELAVVLEELGRVCAPGPFLPTVVAADVIQRFGSDGLRHELLPGIVRGDATVGLGIAGRALRAERVDDGLVVDGELRPLLGGGVASHLLVPAMIDGEGAEVWCLLERDAVDVVPLKSADGTRRVAEVSASNVVVGSERVLGHADVSQAVRDAFVVAASAEAVGASSWCVETASTYAAQRVQFGKPIGTFQAVKHRCAEMLLRTELSRAAAWDAARAHHDADELVIAAAVAGAIVPEAALKTAEDCVQVLGGIGYTWEHDAHLYLKRALAMQHLLGEPGDWQTRVASLALVGARRSLSVELPPEADPIRDEVRAFVAETKAQPRETWTAAMAEAGYLVPYWPKPWGRASSPIEQIVIDEELAAARLRRPHLQVGAWVLPTIINHGTAEQQQRWLPPTLRGEILWCQLFSEPEAGSDLASLSTRAVRDDERGGWRITGQKVWTTMAHISQWGLLLARTDPDAPKHEGITAFVLDMTTPGIDIRPLRELTGAEFFNEVFLTDVFIPDDCVVGEVNAGWDAARTTLANERVSMGSGSSFGPGVEAVLSLLARHEPPTPRADVGELVARGQALAVLGVRVTLRALAGAAPGAEASVRKLLSTEHDQETQEIGLTLLGPDAAIDDGDAARWIGGFLGNRALSIAGGTSDVQRNIVAERILGLPKD